jgi:O-acetyl-ADP-ribose deacetylase (regulator of RNase III)
MNLKTIATFGLGETKIGTTAKSFVSLNIARGSVLDFSLSSTGKTEKSSSPQYSSRRDSSQRSVGAIVNAANERCLSGGGVDGAINNAGGSRLWKDRKALPVLSEEGMQRCHTGGAVVTGPGRYGNLHVNYVVHAVGPAYASPPKYNDRNDTDENDSGRDVSASDEFALSDALLRSAYQESLERCRENGITDVAFSLLSAGVFRGKRSLNGVLAIGVLAIRDWVVEQEKTNSTPTSNDDGEDRVPSSPYRLQSVTLCCYSKDEVDALKKVCRIIFAEQRL